MKKIALVALPILLLLAVAAPSCLATDNRTADQQPAPQYSKLPPLQLSGSTLTQKEYLQAALWLAQQNSKQASTLKNENEWMGVNAIRAAVLTVIVSVTIGLLSIIASILSALHSDKKSKEAQKELFEFNEQLQKNNFRFQQKQTNISKRKDIFTEFLISTSITSLRHKDFDLANIHNQQAHINALNDKRFSSIANNIMNFLDKEDDLKCLQYPSTFERCEKLLQDYKSIYNELSSYVKAMSEENDAAPTLTASK